ncbi:MAG: hypothetical protein J6R01_08110 [Alistipes sp.]|nr:hypothetical protein [Alistipes sp.]
MSENKIIKYDLDGYDTVTQALDVLLNAFPGLSADDEITFAALEETGGKAFFPVSGAAVESEKTSVTGRVVQTCLYPFYVYYRLRGLSESQKANAKEWLENIGRWLERQPVDINGERCKLLEYPPLADGRILTAIERQTPAYLDAITDDQTETWAIYLVARYKYEYQK